MMHSTDSRQRPAGQAGQAAGQLPRLLPADSGTGPAGLASTSPGTARSGRPA